MFLYIPKVSEYEGEWAGIWTILNYTPDSYILLFQYLFLIYFAYLVLFLVVLLFSVKKVLKNPLFFLLSLSIFIPIFAFRHLPLAALLSIPLIAALLNNLKSRTLNISLLLASILMISIMTWLRPIGILSVSESSDKLINFIKQASLSGKAFNHSTTGSFLSYELYPEVKVFFDTRDDLFKGNPTFDDLYQAQMTSGSIMPLLDKYQIDIVIADFFTDSLNYKDLFNSGKWSVIYLNDRYIVAIPTSIAKQKQLEVINGPDPFSQTTAKPGMEKEATDYYRKITQESPHSSSNILLLTQILLSQNENAEAINLLNSLKIPGDPASILLKKQQSYLLAKAHFQNQDCQNTKKFLNILQKDITGKFIFNPSKKIPVINDDLWALYYSRCENDPEQANFYMKQYLNRREINPKNKIKFQQQFMGNSKDQQSELPETGLKP